MTNSCATSQKLIALGQETFDIEIEALQSVKAGLGQSFAEAVSLLASCRGRVIISGIGKSGLVGRKIAATFSSTGTAAFFMHPVEAQHGDLGSIRKEDVLIAISNSGKTDELNAILPPLRSLGVPIISLTGGVDSPMAELSDIVISTKVPKEACPFNLAPTSSTTAVLATGDALAVCLIHCKSFTEKDFKRVHPGGALGQRLRQNIAEIMQRDNIPACPVESSITTAVEVLHQGKLGAVLLLEADGSTGGILTDGDIRRAIFAGTLDRNAPARSIMTSTFQSANQSMSVAEVLDIMEHKAITVLPVLDEKRHPLGIIHMHDLLGKGSISFSK